MEIDTEVMIRPLQDGDDEEWLRQRCALWPKDDPVELRREMAAIRFDLHRQPVYVAQRPDGTLCGIVEVSIRTSAPGCTSNRVGYLEAWYVDPDSRNRSVGRRLVEAAENWALAAGCWEMASDTTPDYPTSPKAHAALGYQEVERYFRKVIA